MGKPILNYYLEHQYLDGFLYKTIFLFGEDIQVKSQPHSVSAQSRCFLCWLQSNSIGKTKQRENKSSARLVSKWKHLTWCFLFKNHHTQIFWLVWWIWGRVFHSHQGRAGASFAEAVVRWHDTLWARSVQPLSKRGLNPLKPFSKCIYLCQSKLWELCSV